MQKRITLGMTSHTMDSYVYSSSKTRLKHKNFLSKKKTLSFINLTAESLTFHCVVRCGSAVGILF